MKKENLWHELSSAELKAVDGGKKEWLFALTPILGIVLVAGIYIGYNQNCE